MPQLDISTWPPQLFWLAICFAALYFVISRLVIPRTGGVIKLRKNTIDGDLAAAVAHKKESEAALAAYEASLAEARSKAGTISLASRTRLSADADAARHKLDAELAAKSVAAGKSIQAAKTKALAGLKDVAADVVASIVDELSGTKITKAAVTAAVAKAAR
jgi:F-type H+-transporting ATPase subunit b